MIALLLHIVFSSGFQLGVKAASQRKANLIVVGGWNYLFAAAFASIWFFGRREVVFGWNGGVYGAANGIIYFLTYFLLIYAIRHQGVAGTTAVGQISVVVPIVASAFLWGEIPTGWQFAGLIVTTATAFLLDARKDALAEIAASLRWVLIGLFLMTGGVRIAAKAFAEAEVPTETPFYVWMVYVSSGAASALLLLREGKMPTRGEWFWSAFVGLCNAVQMAFLLIALEQLPGIVVFPVSACGGLILTTAGAVWFLNERPTRRLYAGIAAAAVAVVLLNARPPDS